MSPERLRASYASSAMARMSSRDIFPTSSGWALPTCCSTFWTSSSLLAARMTSPHSQLITLDMVLLSACRLVGQGAVALEQELDESAWRRQLGGLSFELRLGDAPT